MSEPLLEPGLSSLSKVADNKVYDQQKVYHYLHLQQCPIQSVIPPGAKACVWRNKQKEIVEHQPNQPGAAVKDIGLAEWKNKRQTIGEV